MKTIRMSLDKGCIII